MNKSMIYVIISALLFSTGGLLIKLSTFEALTINGFRSIIAAILMYIVLKKMGHKFVINKYVIIGGIIASVMNSTFVLSTKMTSAGNAIVLQFTQPIFIILIAWIFLKQKPTKGALITCAIVFSGIVCFFFDELTYDSFMGNIFGIISGITYAAVFLFKSFENSDFESSMVLSFVISFFASIPNYLMETDYNVENLVLMLLLGLFQMGIPFILLAKGLEGVSPIQASLTSTFEPILNPILVAVFYGESLGILSIIGGIIVVSASTIYNILQTKKVPNNT